MKKTKEMVMSVALRAPENRRDSSRTAQIISAPIPLPEKSREPWLTPSKGHLLATTEQMSLDSGWPHPET